MEHNVIKLQNELVQLKQQLESTISENDRLKLTLTQLNHKYKDMKYTVEDIAQKDRELSELHSK
ncbi:hypothetical protein OFN60_35185, partial [Escherichia coli]|nr:hypothetical protein [Escherichia coli]